MLSAWEELGGYRYYGKASETSCHPAIQVDDHPRPRVLWPITLYAVTGVVEVVFQHLKRRPPFDDESLRRELMGRLNAIDGIELAEAKLDLRPSFPLEVFADHPEEVQAVLEWFVHVVAPAEARRPVDGSDGGAGGEAVLGWRRVPPLPFPK